jgi:uncharacterized protein YbjT (DUF2867 family)
MLSTEDKIIAVVGATGRQGAQVVRHLVQQGWRIRALTRKPHSPQAARLKPLGVQVVRANLDEPAALEAAFAHVYGVYTAQAPLPGKMEIEIQRGERVASAAQKMGVQHLVYGSAGPGHTHTGIEQWDAKIEITQAMKSLGLPLTTLRPMAFMELMTDPSYYPSSSTWYIWPKLSGWDCQIPWISVQDVGAIAAKVFAQPETYVGQDIPLAADVQSLAACRSLYQEICGQYPSRRPMPLFLFELFVGKDIPKMWRWLRTHAIQVDTHQTRQIHPEAMTVRTWLGRSRS